MVHIPMNILYTMCQINGPKETQLSYLSYSQILRSIYSTNTSATKCILCSVFFSSLHSLSKGKLEFFWHVNRNSEHNNIWHRRLANTKFDSKIELHHAFDSYQNSVSFLKYISNTFRMIYFIFSTKINNINWKLQTTLFQRYVWSKNRNL